MSSPSTAAASRRATIVLFGLLAVTAGIYWPGLYGAFVFDDSTFIVTNARLHVQTLRLGDWVLAAMSFPSGAHQGRWLGMLSFALNHYFTGLDPFWLKLSNLAIHLLNGWLVYRLVRATLALRDACVPEARRSRVDGAVVAALLAGLWLVLTINLTAVLYVSQRLESLSNTFVLLGLGGYVRARIRHLTGSGGSAALWLSLALCTGIGVLVKESAVLLPLYAACVEFALARGRARDGRPARDVRLLFALVLGLPLVAGSIWLLTWVGGETSYARPFTAIERLMTEARVLVDYVYWTLVPQPEQLTLYHDDVVVSRGLLDPPSTLACGAALVAALVAAVALRGRRPLFALGVLWFFAGHALTGTVVPLMLVMEHRNYFPSIGLLVAIASFVVESPATRVRPRAIVLVFACLFAFQAFSTWMRAQEWSDPLRLALSEASKRPGSSAAQYELGRTLLYSRRAGETQPMTEQGFEVLERGARIPASDILHEQLLIVMHAELGRPIEPRWWDSILHKLQTRPPTTADIGGIDALFRCEARGPCPRDYGRLKAIFDAAVAWPSTDGVLLTMHGAFAEHALGDLALAERQYRAALARAPGEPLTHANLIRLLAREGRLDEARAQLARLRRLNHFGSIDSMVQDLAGVIESAPPAPAAAPAGGADAATAAAAG